MTHSLALGPLLLTGSLPDVDNGFVFNVLAEGTTFGVAAGVQEVVTSLLADGDLVRTTRFGNRQVSFVVEISGPTLDSLNFGEKALRDQVGVGNTLAWNAPDVMTVPTAFDVIDSSMEPQFDDLDELRRKRRFVVTLTCSPFARSVVGTTVAALAPPPVTPVTVSINAATSATGWSGYLTNSAGTGPITPTAQGTFVRVEANSPWSYPAFSSSIRLGLTAVSMATTPYLLVEASASSTTASQVDFYATMNGVAKYLPIVSSRMTTSGTTIYVLNAGTGSLTSLTMNATYAGGATGVTRLDVHDVSRTDTIPQVSKRQQTRIIEVGGTERTPATLHISSTNPASGLGMTIVHTSPADGSGYSPPLRRWRISGNGTPTTATDTFSGAYEPIHTSAVVFEVPNSAIPEGDYALCAALKSSTVGTFNINWSAQTRLVSSSSGTAPFEGSTPVQFFTTTDWHFASLTPLSLPTMRGNSGSFVRIAIQFQGSQPPTIILDDAWLFRVDTDCALTVTNSTPQHLWIDSPDVNNPVPRTSFSTQASRSDEWSPGVSLLASGSHVLRPTGTSVFTATRDFDNPATEASFYRRWHTNAAS